MLAVHTLLLIVRVLEADPAPTPNVFSTIVVDARGGAVDARGGAPGSPLQSNANILATAVNESHDSTAALLSASNELNTANVALQARATQICADGPRIERDTKLLQDQSAAAVYVATTLAPPRAALSVNTVLEAFARGRLHELSLFADQTGRLPDITFVRGLLKRNASPTHLGPYVLNLDQRQKEKPTLGDGNVEQIERLAAVEVGKALGPDVVVTSAFRPGSSHARGSIDIQTGPDFTAALWAAELLSRSVSDKFTGAQVLAEFVEPGAVKAGAAEKLDFLVVAYFRDGELYQVRAGRRGLKDLHATGTHIHLDLTNACIR